MEGAPKEVGGDFSCYHNQLVSLEGAPKQVGGNFRCDYNQIVSLEGSPERVGGSFTCNHNLLVGFKGLEGVSIGGSLNVTNADSNSRQRDNVFVSLEALPKEWYSKVWDLDIKALLALKSQHSIKSTDKLLLPTEPFLKGKPLEVWLDTMGIKNWSINGGLVDVEGSVDLFSRLEGLERLPVRFGKVSGKFNCGANYLVSLEGAPKEVGGDFNCYDNQLVSLEGAPETVGSFECGKNQLVSLEGAPKKVGGDFRCGGNQLVSLEGGPKEVGNNFNCVLNQLVSLEGAPERVGGYFSCSHNLLVDFKGLEDMTGCWGLYVINPELAGQDNVFVSLEGLPKKLYGRVEGLDIQSLIALESQHSGITDVTI